MSKMSRLTFISLLAGLLLGACAQQAQPTATPLVKTPLPTATAPGTLVTQVAAKEAWETKWAKVSQEAKKEGKVVVYGSAVGNVRQALIDGFNQKHGIPVEYLAAKGPEIAQKILSEQRAGLYVADVIIGASTPAISQLKPAGALDRLEPVLILPEVVDPKVWWQNELPWVDKDHHFIAFLAYDSNIAKIATNSDMVKPGEIKGFRDLLDPKWKGKIVMHDPTIEGSANSFLGTVVLYDLMGGLDYLRQLASQEPFISRDHRLLSEWLARGKYPIGVAVEAEAIQEMRVAGAPIEVVSASEFSVVVCGTGFLSLPKNAPHPNASTLFINWLLSKEGQTAYTDVARFPSGRVDIPTTNLDPSYVRKPGVKYLHRDTEEFFLKGPDWLKQGKEIFGHLTK